MTIKILTICDYGQVRSVGMKCYLNGLQRYRKNRIDKLEYDKMKIIINYRRYTNGNQKQI